MSGTNDILRGHVSRDRDIRMAGLAVRVIASLAAGSLLLAGGVIWLVLSQPVEVASALTGHDAWQVAVAITRMLATIVVRLAAWL